MTSPQRATLITVAIVDDDESMRSSLKWMLEFTDGYACAGSYASCAEALEGLGTSPADVVLMDIGMPGTSGIACVRKLKELFPQMQVVMQTVYSDDDRIFESLRAGAVGYILKKTPSLKLLQAISDAYAGGAPMSGEVARRVLAFFQRPPAPADGTVLTERETEVLEALIEGHSYKVIAERLYVSVHTVRFHLHNIYEKLHVGSRAEAVAKVMQQHGRAAGAGRDSR